MHKDRPHGANHAERVGLIVLGAGLSSRFGKTDKLSTEVGGLPLAHHVLNTTRAFMWSSKILVCHGTPSWTRAYAEAGFALVSNNNPERGLLSSVKSGLHALKDETHVMICLADMPFVPAEHFAELLSQIAGAGTRPVASSADNYLGPPAIFSVDAINQLPYSGDSGARALLTNALFVESPREKLFDIDTSQDLKVAASLAAKNFSCRS